MTKPSGGSNSSVSRSGRPRNLARKSSRLLVVPSPWRVDRRTAVRRPTHRIVELHPHRGALLSPGKAKTIGWAAPQGIPDQRRPRSRVATHPRFRETDLLGARHRANGRTSRLTRTICIGTDLLKMTRDGARQLPRNPSPAVGAQGRRRPRARAPVIWGTRASRPDMVSARSAALFSVCKDLWAGQLKGGPGVPNIGAVSTGSTVRGFAGRVARGREGSRPQTPRARLLASYARRKFR
jgi:hypothetical protein